MKTVYVPKFMGMFPKVSPKLLEPLQSQIARNCVLESGRLVPIRGMGAVSGASSGETIYKWRRTGIDPLWLNWSADVNVVSGLVADDEYSRIYYTGDGAPKVKGWVDGAAVSRDLKFDKPAVPTVTSIDPVWGATALATATCTQFFYIYKMKEVEYADGTKGFEKDTLSYELEHELSISDYTFTDDGLILTFKSYNGLLASIGTDGYYGAFGCRYVLSFPEDGKNAEFTIPLSGDADFDSPKFSSDTKELVDSDEIKFATMQIVSVEDTDVENYIKVDGSSQSLIAIGQPIKFRINMQYVDGGTKYVHYVQTKVNDWNVESLPSDATEMIEVKGGHRVTLGVGGATGAPARIYRSAAGSTDTAFFFVDDSEEGTYVDKKADSELAEQLTIYENPDDDLKGLVAMPGGFLAAFKEDTQEIHFSAPYLPHSWSTEYRVTIDSDIVGLGVSGNDLVVLTKDYPYLITGDHPDSMSVTKLAFPQSCISKKSICNLGNMVCYASPDGFCSIQAGSGEILTAKAFSKEDWLEFLPDDEDDYADVVANIYDRKIYVFSSKKGLIIDATDGNITETDKIITATFRDAETDSLYVVSSGVKKWDDPEEDYLQATWKTKEFWFGKPVNFVAARIVADTYDTTPKQIQLLIYADGVLVKTLDISDDVAFKIPDLFPEKTWSFEIKTYSPVDELVVSTAMAGAKGNA